MGRAIKLVLYYFAYQLAFTFLVGLPAGIIKVMNEISENDNLAYAAGKNTASMTGLVMVLAGIAMIWHLIYFKYVQFNKTSWTEVPAKTILLSIPFIIAAMFICNVASEFIELPNLVEDTFIGMSRNVFGIIAIAVMAPLVEELLFRKPIVMSHEKTNAYYRDKVVLITGGGGSIGSELCRQLAKMHPKQIIILDIYENGAYDVQQELKIAYGNQLNLQIEICSITHRKALEKVFETYHPQIVINAAAHKHVPLMEHNCVEAIYNNVFGTYNLVELCEEYEAERFMMVSTDKAVNPTNVMGATKRMCEMIVQSASTYGKVKYSATRFGNVLGSAGSVIPLFKRQIANGGPVTVTDKRIIRYFMTIPEASQLVLQSGAIAKNGELFVLDMGQPVKILDLAENMIRLSGVEGIDIVETGLRPGEKLYEELLVKTEELDKTENSMIFIERDTALSQEEIEEKMQILREACDSGDNLIAKQAMRKVVPTFKSPEEVNCHVANEKQEEKAEEKVEVHKKPGMKAAIF